MEALYAVVAAEQLDRAEANRIADESRGLGLLPIQAEQAGRKGPWLLELAGVHLLLEEGASPDSVSLNLTPEGVERLAQTFEWLFHELPGEFTFEVLWGAEPIDKLVSREELVRIVHTGHLAGRTRYRVWPG
ncbi:MAG: hypothetical protein ACRDNG_11775 [Gaiellaceae bacterium]